MILKIIMWGLAAALMLVIGVVSLNLYIVNQKNSASYLAELSQAAEEKAIKLDTQIIQDKINKLMQLKLITTRPDLVELKMLIDVQKQQQEIVTAVAIDNLITKIEDEYTRIFFATAAIDILPLSSLSKYWARSQESAQRRHQRQEQGNTIVTLIVNQLQCFSTLPRQSLMFFDLFNIPTSETVKMIELMNQYNNFIEHIMWWGDIEVWSDKISIYASIGNLEKQCAYVWLAKNKTLSGKWLEQVLNYSLTVASSAVQSSIFSSLLSFNKNLTYHMLTTMLKAVAFDQETATLFMKTVLESSILKESEKKKLLSDLIEQKNLSKNGLNHLFVIAKDYGWYKLNNKIAHQDHIN